MPQAVVNATIVSKSPYLNMPDSLTEILLHAQSLNVYTTKQIQEICKKGFIMTGKVTWTLSKDGLLQHNGCIYVPNQCVLIEEILCANHNNLQWGHFGIKQTIKIIQNKYYWCGLSKDISSYIQTCYTCQQVKPHQHKPYGKLGTIPMSSIPWETISMDFISSFSASTYYGTTYDVILVITNIFSKVTIYIPCLKNITAEELADLVWETAFCFFSLPCVQVSNWGSLFTSKYWSTLCYTLSTKYKLTTAFYPQMNGQMEHSILSSNEWTNGTPEPDPQALLVLLY